MIFLTLENPRAGCKKRTSLFRVTKALCHYNSTEYTENILIKKYGLPELLVVVSIVCDLTINESRCNNW